MTTSRRQKKLPPVPPEVRAAVLAGKRHKKRCAPLTLEQVDKMTRAYRAALVERRAPGRKPFLQTVKVVGMIMAGLSWQQVYEEVGCHSSDKYERAYQQRRLRRGVEAYMKRHGLKRPRRNGPPVKSRRRN
jgi:hypothetical protein